MKLHLLILVQLFVIIHANAQGSNNSKPAYRQAGPKLETRNRKFIDSTWVGDIKVTIDQNPSEKGRSIICFFALPNGNSTEWTMGKKMDTGDNWHYDIQHIRAQTEFIRSKMKGRNFIVVYLENKFKSWPSWKQQHADFKQRLPFLIDSISMAIGGKHRTVYLNGHSGGGSLIFGYLSGVESIPPYIKRISFIDSDYGYDSSYYPKLSTWLKERNNVLTVFAYNDSVAIYNGKPLVSATGGTWYRSRLMLSHLQKEWTFNSTETDSMFIHRSTNNKLFFYLKKNTDHGIYHTQQVELNGFIHSIFAGTKLEEKEYEYYKPRTYTSFIK